ncbi:ribbon-helix-helix domain-containing protein [Nonomuraea aridisoli]|uniref:RNA polymerase alpha subunit C-terminal domain-containing protein n=1 Tax=Nonomuraea aridisoli TaxID=2070368 RepID=A0A2W2DWW6_9ACTN|nr:DNA-directed RNA polymerase subunit alpha C-terminal domain-containing protein [Nonomuraea aridisoli]PZG04318.1 hypothetical protein C1J01_44765 [Nonomuraea aridisoli]
MSHDTHLPLDELARRSGRPREALIEEALSGLAISVHNVLRRNDVHTLGDLLDRGETGLAEIPYFGRRSMALVKAVLIRSMPSMVTPQEAAQTLRSMLDTDELFTRLSRDGSTLDVRSGRANEFPAGPITHVTVHATAQGPTYAIAAPPLPGRDAGPARVTRYAGEAATWIRAQTLYPYECQMDCGSPAGVGCKPSCQSFPEDRYTPPPTPEEDSTGGGLFADEPPFPEPYDVAGAVDASGHVHSDADPGL